MEYLNKYLKDWLIKYLKNRDIIARQIVEINTINDDLFVKYKTKETYFMIEPFIENIDFDKISKDHQTSNVSLVTYNTTLNINQIIKNWKQLIKYSKLNIYFINPFSKTEKQWIIFPKTHNLLTENPIKALKAISENVEIITKEKLIKITKI